MSIAFPRVSIFVVPAQAGTQRLRPNNENNEKITQLKDAGPLPSQGRREEISRLTA